MKKYHSDLSGSSKGHGCELLPVTGAAGLIPASSTGCPAPSPNHWQNVRISSLLGRRSIKKGLMEVLFVTVGWAGCVQPGWAAQSRRGGVGGCCLLAAAGGKREMGLEQGQEGDSSATKPHLILRAGGERRFSLVLISSLNCWLFLSLSNSSPQWEQGASCPGGLTFPSHLPWAKQGRTQETQKTLWHAHRVNQGVKQNLCSQLANVSKENISNAGRDGTVSRWCNYMAVSCRNSFNVAHIKPFRGSALIFNFTLLAGNQGL